MNAKIFLARTYNGIVNPIQFWVEKQSELNPGGLADFIDCLWNWMKHVPRRELCENCHKPVWTLGISEVFCSNYCFESYEKKKKVRKVYPFLPLPIDYTSKVHEYFMLSRSPDFDWNTIPEWLERANREMKTKILITYSSTNSGGEWPLSDKDWKALEDNGWTIESDAWGEKFARKEFSTIRECLEQFERLTGQDVSCEGFGDDGAPHSFSWESGECSGIECLPYLGYTIIPDTFREAVELLNERRDE